MGKWYTAPGFLNMVEHYSARRSLASIPQPRFDQGLSALPIDADPQSLEGRC